MNRAGPVTVIRAAVPRDASAVASLLAELGIATSDGWQLNHEMLSSHGTQVLVATWDLDVVGLACFHVAFRLTEPPLIARLTEFVVASRARGARVGEALLGEVEIRAAKVGAERLELTCGWRVERHSAHCFYRARGFTNVCDDAAVYAKQLSST